MYSLASNTCNYGQADHRKEQSTMPRQNVHEYNTYTMWESMVGHKAKFQEPTLVVLVYVDLMFQMARISS